jgi:hypothetical protein
LIYFTEPIIVSKIILSARSGALVSIEKMRIFISVFVEGSIMKKLIFMSLCFLFMAGTSAFAYQVTGRVLDTNGNGVGGASVTINCYPSSGGSLSDSDTSSSTVPVGHYNGGWLATDCRGEKIVVKAVKGALSGTVSFNASNLNSDVKNVTIRPTLHATAELHCGPEPVPMEPLIPADSNVFLYVQLVAGPALVNGGTVDMQYNTETMTCSNVDFLPPFVFSSPPIIDPVAGTIHVELSSTMGLVPVDNGENPTPFFSLTLEGNSETPGKVSSVTVTSTEIDSNEGLISAFPDRTDYVVDGEPNEACKPYFRIADQAEWEQALLDGHVYQMELEDWQNYMTQWQLYVEDGCEPYPDTNFMPAEPPTGGLYVYEGNDANPNEPNDAGLVMGWGDSDGNSTSAWVWDYKKDPDLSNCMINLVVTAPQFGVNGQVTQVSFGLQNPPNIGGPIRAWYWNCGAAGSGAPITWGVPTRLTIDTTKTGVGAATPTASAYMNNPGFSLKLVQWILLDENGTWVGGPNPVPAFGQFSFLWNYWHWILVSPKTTLSKEIYKKWSQPPVVIDSNHPPILLGWNEYSDFNDPCIVADDFNCTDDRPITDVHWWGSFLGWNDPWRPPVLPLAFHLGIWTNVPDSNVNDPTTFSHPGMLIWENYCDNYVWNFAGYDYDPRDDMAAAGTITEPCAPPKDYEPNEACFQFTQLLSEDEWFWQEPDPCDPNGRVYWLSIAPIWDPCNPPTHKWGWKTRPRYFEDDAVSMQPAPWHPPIVWGTTWAGGIPIQYPAYPDPDSLSWDMTFELTTNEPDPNKPGSADLNYDGIVNLKDLAILGIQWLDNP